MITMTIKPWPTRDQAMLLVEEKLSSIKTLEYQTKKMNKKNNFFPMQAPHLLKVSPGFMDGSHWSTSLGSTTCYSREYIDVL